MGQFMAYIDTRLPISVEKGASGGPTFNTTVHTLASGKEQRNQNWAHPLGKWDISYGLRAKQEPSSEYGLQGLSDIVSFFYAMRGKEHSFRFRDWLDYFVIENEIEQVGDNRRTEFQLTKRYSTNLLHGSSPVVYHRKITRPSAVGITYSDPDPADPNINDNNPQEDTDASVPKIEKSTNGGNWEVLEGNKFTNVSSDTASADDYFAKTGIIKFNYSDRPGQNTKIRWSGFFDNHVRFDTDSLNVTLDTYHAGEIPDIPIVEVRS